MGQNCATNCLGIISRQGFIHEQELTHCILQEGVRACGEEASQNVLVPHRSWSAALRTGSKTKMKGRWTLKRVFLSSINYLKSFGGIVIDDLHKTNRVSNSFTVISMMLTLVDLGLTGHRPFKLMSGNRKNDFFLEREIWPALMKWAIRMCIIITSGQQIEGYASPSMALRIWWNLGNAVVQFGLLRQGIALSHW